MSDDVFTDMLEDEVEPLPPCPRCGYCGFIENAAMNLAGVCPECHGAGRAIIRHNAKTEGPPTENSTKTNQ